MSPGRRNLLVRAIGMIVGVFLLWLLLFGIPAVDFLLFRLFIVLISALGACEVARMARWEYYPFAAIAGSAVPVALLLSLYHITPQIGEMGAITVVLLSILAARALTRNPARLSGSLHAITVGTLVSLYPGLLGAYFLRLTALPHAAIVIAVFVTTVSLHDVAAYVWGKLVGGGTIVAASPTKTLAGFVGGTLCAVPIIPLAGVLFPNAFGAPWPLLLLLGMAVIVAANLGDLAESAIKRSVSRKDSGRLALGRGGIMDAFDSHLFAVPIFYWLYPQLMRTTGC